MEAGEEEEAKRAEEAVEATEEMRHSVRLRHTTQRLLGAMKQELFDSNSDERIHKLRAYRPPVGRWGQGGCRGRCAA